MWMRGLLLLNQLTHIQGQGRQSQIVSERSGFPRALLDQALWLQSSQDSFEDPFCMRHKRSPHTASNGQGPEDHSAQDKGSSKLTPFIQHVHLQVPQRHEVVGIHRCPARECREESSQGSPLVSFLARLNVFASWLHLVSESLEPFC